MLDNILIHRTRNNCNQQRTKITYSEKIDNQNWPGLNVLQELRVANDRYTIYRQWKPFTAKKHKKATKNDSINTLKEL